MNQRLKYLIAIMIIFCGCGNSISTVQDNELADEFFLENAQGNKATEFSFGEDISFVYSIENRTGNFLPYIKQNTGPFVAFEVYQGNTLVGSSVDGFAFIPVIVSDTLNNGQSLLHKYNWLSVSMHEPLSVGDYTAVAKPLVEFNGVPNAVPQQIEFSVTAAFSGAVMTTDLPPDSIQLNAFDLNSISIFDNKIVLNLSYSGGCVEHEFTLFMSPAAFLESNPVQANLFLRHNGFDDPCDAYITTEISFDLKAVAELYQQQYGRKDEIILNVFDYFKNVSGNNLSASYFPKEETSSIFKRL